MAGAIGAYGYRDLEDELNTGQKRRRLVELVDMGFKFDMAGLLADGLELDPSDVADASIANELLASGLKTLAAVKTVTGEVEANMAMVHAKPAILSLRELAPSLTDVKALQLAKGACTPAVLQRCNNEDPTALPEDRQTDEELAAKIAENIQAANLTEEAVVSYEIAGRKKSFAVLMAHSNEDGSIRVFLNNKPHCGFTYCMACSSFMWPLRPPPALVPPSKDIKGKLWNAADAALRGMAADQAAAARGGGGSSTSGGSGGGRSGSGGVRRASGGSASNARKRGSSDGETSGGQVLPRRVPLPAACISGPEPSSDVADHEFFNGLCGWMPVASGSSQLANIRTHLTSQTHRLNMTALRLLARSGAGHFSWLPQPVAGARMHV